MSRSRDCLLLRIVVQISRRRINVGIIVGAAVGALVGIMALITFGILSYYCLRGDGRRTRRLQKRTPRPNMNGVVSPPASFRQGSARKEVLSHYNPEPFSSRPSTMDFSQGSVRQGYIRQGYPPPPAMQQPMSRLANTSAGNVAGVGASTSQSHGYSQFGSRYAPPPHPPSSSSMYGTSQGLGQKGSYPSITSGGSGVGPAETSSPGGSGYGGAPSMTTRSSYPILARPVSGGYQDDAGPSEALPGYPAPGLPPRNDAKFKIRNP